MQHFSVIALGGSLIVPYLSDTDGIDVPFLKSFRKFIVKELTSGRRIVIVAGGGKTARVYNSSAAKIVPMTDEDLDWIGIHATRLNAHLLRTIFVKEAHPVIIDHDPSPKEIEAMKKSTARLFIASGWRPGWSTDYVAVKLAEKFGGREVVIAGDISHVYDKDPKKQKDAKKIKQPREDFLGSVKTDHIVGMFKRRGIITGDVKTAKQIRKDKKVKVGITSQVEARPSKKRRSTKRSSTMKVW